VTLDVWNGSDASGTPARSQSAPASGGAWALTLDPVLTDGATYTAQARQTDAAGNVGVTAARTFTVPLTIQAAGDIARCGGLGDEATGALVQTLAGTVATLGDNVYDDHVNPEGSLANFVNCFEPTWGPLKPRTRPAAGNHEYNADPAASGYFDYFNGIGNSDGPAGPRGKGYYSYEKGAWHIVVLNTNNNCAASLVSCGAGSPQETWLRADLAAHPGECTLAYFHHPRFASALYNGTTAGSNPRVKPLWDALYDYGAELVLNGHAHNYERYRPVDPAGTPDSAYGIREIISGEGGASHPLYSGTHDDNSEAFDSSTFGVVEVRLGPGGYSWHYTPAPGTGPFAGDSGSGACHAAPPPSP
jgi:hypothetical protein